MPPLAQVVPADARGWVLDRHHLAHYTPKGDMIGIAQAVAYGDLGNESPSPITADYERLADLVIELQLEKAGVRLAHLLNDALR
jgi:hypothetical protein